MVESLHADVALVAVRGSRGSVNETGTAEFDLKVVSFDGHAEDPAKISHLSVLVLLIKGNFTGLFVLVA